MTAREAHEDYRQTLIDDYLAAERRRAHLDRIGAAAHPLLFLGGVIYCALFFTGIDMTAPTCLAMAALIGAAWLETRGVKAEEAIINAWYALADHTGLSDEMLTQLVYGQVRTDTHGGAR